MLGTFRYSGSSSITGTAFPNVRDNPRWSRTHSVIIIYTPWTRWGHFFSEKKEEYCSQLLPAVLGIALDHHLGESDRNDGGLP